MKGQQPERGRSQGRGVRHERSAAKRASILDGGPSGGYKRQHRLQRGAPLYCVKKNSSYCAHPGSPPDFLSSVSMSSNCCLSCSNSFFLAVILAVLSLISPRLFCCIIAFCGSL